MGGNTSMLRHRAWPHYGQSSKQQLGVGSWESLFGSLDLNFPGINITNCKSNKWIRIHLSSTWEYLPANIHISNTRAQLRRARLLIVISQQLNWYNWWNAESYQIDEDAHVFFGKPLKQLDGIWLLQRLCNTFTSCLAMCVCVSK